MEVEVVVEIVEELEVGEVVAEDRVAAWAVDWHFTDQIQVLSFLTVRILAALACRKLL